jgi:D-sedoheptulose 7-phosphate isomerase
MKAELYYRVLRELTRNIVVADKSGRSIGTQAGFDKAIMMIKKCAKSGGKLIFIGNGASAAISSHMSADFWKNGKIKAVAFNDIALLTAVSNDYGYPFVFEKPVKMFAQKKDLIFAISSSGRSENILRAVKAARLLGASVITLSGFHKANPLRKMGSINFYIPAGEYGLVEVLHHSICHCLLDSIVSGRKG